MTQNFLLLFLIENYYFKLIRYTSPNYIYINRFIKYAYKKKFQLNCFIVFELKCKLSKTHAIVSKSKHVKFQTHNISATMPFIPLFLQIFVKESKIFSLFEVKLFPIKFRKYKLLLLKLRNILQIAKFLTKRF